MYKKTINSKSVFFVFFRNIFINIKSAQLSYSCLNWVSSPIPSIRCYGNVKVFGLYMLIFMPNIDNQLTVRPEEMEGKEIELKASQ